MRPAKVLVLTHGYPPVGTPQALRTAYQVRELARAGHQVRVLCAATRQSEGQLIPNQVDSGVRRVFPGPATALVDTLHRVRRTTIHGRAGKKPTSAARVSARDGLNWKGRLSKRIRGLADLALYPGSHAEWLPWAHRAAAAEFDRFRPDVLLSSHEPPDGILIALGLVRRSVVPWVADLGDPVLADYTTPRWRSRALQLESRMMRMADSVLVTNHATRRLLLSRHGERSRVEVMPQGFDADVHDCGNDCPFEPGALNLLYTGRLYRFRDPTPLLDAVAGLPGVILWVAAPNGLGEWDSRVADCSGRVRLLGQLTHRQCLYLQRRANVLVSISNERLPQTPGKVMEYLGSSRPVLILGEGDGDESSKLIEGLNRGWSCPNSVGAVSAQLSRLLDRHVRGELEKGLSLGAEPVREFSWSAHGERLSAICQAAAHRALRS